MSKNKRKWLVILTKTQQLEEEVEAGSREEAVEQALERDEDSPYGLWEDSSGGCGYEVVEVREVDEDE